MNLLLPIAVAWIVGLLLASHMPSGQWQPFLALVSLAIGILMVVRGLYRKPESPSHTYVVWKALLVAATLAAGLSVRFAEQQSYPFPPSGLARMQVAVQQVRYLPDGKARSVVRVLSGIRIEDSSPLVKGVLLQLNPIPLPEGARVELVAHIRPWVPFRNPSPHPSLTRPSRVQGYGWIPSAQAVRILNNPGIQGLITALRSAVRRVLIETLPNNPAGIARAVILGDNGAVHPDNKNAVRSAGLAHIFAVSGLHVTILAGLTVRLFQQLLILIPWLAERFEVRRVACTLGVPLALGFAAFAGGAPSAWRASTTAAITWSLVALGKRPNPSATASAAVILLSAVYPYHVLHPGFLLSIVATAAILSAPQKQCSDLVSWIKISFTLSIRTSIATAPIILWCFGSVPLIGSVANMLLVPIGSVLLIPLAALHTITASCVRALAPITALPFCTVSNAFVEACHACAQISLFQQPLPPLDIGQGLCIGLSALLLLSLSGIHSRIIVCGFAVVALVLLEARLRITECPVGKLRITYLDVGQGDSALVDLPDGRLMLIDAGGNPLGGIDPGRTVLEPMLRARRRKQIDIVVLSHPHPDHYGGLEILIDQFRVNEFWDTGQAVAESERELNGVLHPVERLLSIARKKHTRIRGPEHLCYHPLRAGGATVQVLWPCPNYDPGYGPNDNSFVLRISYSGKNFLFTGDIERITEARLLKENLSLHADVLKVPHHGSDTSSSGVFLKALQPSYAIISSGAFNRHGHPATCVINRLERLGTKVIRLSHVGGTIVTYDGEVLKTKSWQDKDVRF